MKRCVLVLTSSLTATGCSGERQGVAVPPPPTASTRPVAAAIEAPLAALPEAAPLNDLADPTCAEQKPQEYLQRAHLNRAAKSREERAEMLRNRAQAIAFRTREYGYFEGFGDKRDNPKSPAKQSTTTTFFGLPVILHERVVPALRCVEKQLMRDCADFNYKPYNLSGLRRKNTYVDGEVSSHVYGIAIDIDPLRNPCCKCLEPWSSSERCKGKHKTIWERMAMPKCWVDTFERFGFYWLGHDTLEDTMHFEFLGDPEKVHG